ncbi:hypothetical protein [Nonomuraea ferruginea]|uniref:Major facilitator superfamily (MFS) profile domain-containing protein n=1 Tax=Nonomuraea ferruginea TaxID=46174 RepID=A0ABT4TCX5_9ACTN|nr:hypothetical protein [Nonomuraea ferruginea]MDA0647377.1 hypothetical protein [Nonomuraea ferruginea]
MKPFYVRELSVYPVGARRVRLLAIAVLASLVANFETTIATILPLLMTDLGMSLEEYGLIAALSVLVGGCPPGSAASCRTGGDGSPSWCPRSPSPPPATSCSPPSAR